MRSLILFLLSILIFGLGGTPANSHNSPFADVTVKGSNEPITIDTNDSLSITISLDASGNSDNADWWLAIYTPYGWFYLDVYTGSWLQGLSFTYQGPLVDLPPIEVLSLPGLPPGTYTVCFAVDMDMNGQLDFDKLHYDAVVVNVTEASTSSLTGTWITTNFNNYISLILTEPDVVSDKNYTWINECTESGTYEVSGSNITFHMYFTDCEEGSGLVGAESDLSYQKQLKQNSRSYEYSLTGNGLNIKKIRLGTQTIDLLLDRSDPSSWQKIGSGTVSVFRHYDFGNCYTDIVGDVPFTIFRSPHFGPDVHHDEVYGYGDLKGELTCAFENCNYTLEAKGMAEIRGYFAEVPFGSTDSCMLGLAITDNYYWGKCTITKLSGDCGGLHVGWINPDPCMMPSPEWLEFPLVKGCTIHKAYIPNVEDYTLQDIETVVPCYIGGQ